MISYRFKDIRSGIRIDWDWAIIISISLILFGFYIGNANGFRRCEAMQFQALKKLTAQINYGEDL